MYCVYSATNTMRAKGERPSCREHSMDMLKQASVNAVAGHSQSVRRLDDIFAIIQTNGGDSRAFPPVELASALLGLPFTRMVVMLLL